MTHQRTAWIGWTALAAGLLLLGCSGKNKTNPDPTNTGEPTAPGGSGAVTQTDSPGYKIYEAQKCTDCHSIGPAAPGGKPKKPLTTVGKDPDHTVDWISAHVRNAKQHNPRSKMREYPPDQLSDADLKVLAEYLASLK